jgi:hypothetical protein
MTRTTYPVDPSADVEVGDVIHTDDGPRRVTGTAYHQSRRWGPAAQVTTEPL